jgi:cytosine/adenosine deaminase-related metal-dependent hydrolase
MTNMIGILSRIVLLALMNKVRLFLLIFVECFIFHSTRVGTIVFVSSDEAELKAKHAQYFEQSQATLHDYGARLLTPGFIDTHCHGPQYVNAGIGIDL